MPHLQHRFVRAPCCCLLAAAQLAKRAAILFAQPFKVSNLGVCREGLQPAGHRRLRVESEGEVHQKGTCSRQGAAAGAPPTALPGATRPPAPR